ncbi:aldehyde dehydrogenase family protein, partial [Clostridium prolinivorans]|uniref:aldehyde dehydrogenase family protein n=1 Tax=Clostridium prolinivorans TaxID=2769420 RepID=UPI000FD985C9
MSVTNIDELMNKIKEVREAQKKFSQYSQEEVNEIFRQAAMAANNARIYLAKMAAEETGMGIVEDKVIKNHFASEYIYNQYKDEKTCGVIEKDESFGIVKVAEPIGVVAAVIPTTNPTSTAIFKSLISLKTRNGIIFSPHPRAKKSTIEAAKIVLEAAVKAGAPKNIIGWIDEPTLDMTHTLMSESDIILATGGPGLVKAAYSSGRPAIGVGSGNTPAIIDETAHIKMAVSSIILSKTFDNGVVCASEQAVIVLDDVYEEVKEEFIERGAYILKESEIDKVRNVILKENFQLNSAIVGQPAYKIANMAGIEISENYKVLIGEVENVDLKEAFAHEKLSPILGMYRAKNFEEALDIAVKIIELGGFGHTSVLYTDQVKCKD